MIDWIAALDRVVARTGHGRFRALCDAAHPDHAAWRARVVGLAADPPGSGPARRPVAESAELARAMRACPYRSTEGCGCAGGRCALRGGAIVSHRDCFPCLERYGR